MKEREIRQLVHDIVGLNEITSIVRKQKIEYKAVTLYAAGQELVTGGTMYLINNIYLMESSIGGGAFEIMIADKDTVDAFSFRMDLEELKGTWGLGLKDVLTKKIYVKQAAATAGNLSLYIDYYQLTY